MAQHRPGRLNPLLRWLLIGGALGTVAGAAVAQQSAATQEPTLGEVQVKASGLGLSSADMSTPATVLDAEPLMLRQAATLGETLDGEPGIHASHFGAGASRPIIRGMDGPRVQILSDGAELHDASTISPDHAVASEPMLATQIEVLRGPSALIYGGGGAMGGVVNILDDKIPTAIPAQGITGSAQLRGNTGAGETAGAFSLTGGAGQLAIHAEGMARDAGDYRVGSGWAPNGQSQGRVAGSFNRTDTGSLGLSWIGTQGYLGLAYTRQAARYGLPGHNHSFEGCHTHGNHLHCGSHGVDDGHDHGDGATVQSVPVVDLVSERLDLRGEWRNPVAGIAALRVRGGWTDYRHDEIEDGQVSTTFRNRAHDLRVEAEHAPIAGWRGVIGLQTMQRRFSAEGEEAYVQPTETRRNSLYLMEEYRWQDWRWQAAMRHERQTVDAERSAVSRSHSGTSFSLGSVWKFTPGYSLSASLTQGSRLPTAEELYANGLHMATSTYERGNAELRRERSQALDIGLRKTAGDTTFSVNAFHHRVKGYIYGATLDEHDGLQLLQYTQADARFTGIEGQVRHKLSRQWGVTLFGDAVRARLDDGSALPRIPAARAGVRVDTFWKGWDAQAEWVQVLRQNRTAAFETATDGYGLLNVSASYTLRTASGMPWQFFVKGQNLTNRLAYAHTSFIKSAAPLMGRNITVGVKVSF
ncbi:TonB-dependent receptor domain-containing protein [Delftia sp. PS-11]|uniref:TonB-dependent receptor domain-containing protein n=1 Tax=Delftia sp. PS-11 TaxID=2767222 RepID=UPI0024549490|nr:TonB-dependent receptor [Delftia sp. PS-11]KAJ8742555.1 TonB-dependent receptor [Delftia sp. PS-11]